MSLSFRPGRSRLAATVCALGALALAGCSGSDNGGSGNSTTTSATAAASAPGSSATPAAAKNTIIIDNFKFMPSKLTVKAGTKVTVTNKDTTAHTVTGTGSAKGKFNTGHIAPGKTKRFTAPKKAGSYPFDCSIHPFMKGTLTVK
jgi:plastocyanin